MQQFNSHQFGNVEHVRALRAERAKDEEKVQIAVFHALSAFTVEKIVAIARREKYPIAAARALLNRMVGDVTETRVYVSESNSFIYEYAIIELLSRFDDIRKELEAIG